MSISLLTRLKSRSSISSMLEEKDGSSSELRLSWLLSLGVMEPFLMLLMLLFSWTLSFSGTFLSWKTSRMLCLELALSGVSTVETLVWLPDPLVTDVVLVLIAELELLLVLAMFPLFVITSVLVVFSVLELETRDSVLVTVCDGGGGVALPTGEEGERLLRLLALAGWLGRVGSLALN